MSQVIDSYKLIFTGDGTDTFPTAFPLGITSGTIDLLTPEWGGAGSKNSTDHMEFLIAGTPAGSGVLQITGATDAGPEEPIGSLAITIGSVVETGDYRWVDTIVETDWHLGAVGVKVADSGNSHPCKVGIDLLGYRFIKLYSTSLTTTTAIRVYARRF